MTSNIGAEPWKKQGTLGFKPQKDERTYKDIKEQLLEQTKKAFKPEFLNRVDDIIVFRPLTKENVQDIIGSKRRIIKSKK